VPQKRVEIALDAVATLRTRVPGLHLDVVGTGWWEPQLRERVAGLGLEADVTFHGHVSEAEKHRLLARAWVHAMPSLKEGWGLVVVEAGVHGTPTVAFRRAGGPADSIVDQETGLLVGAAEGEPEVEAFARTLESLLTDDARRERRLAAPALKKPRSPTGADQLDGDQGASYWTIWSDAEAGLALGVIILTPPKMATRPSRMPTPNDTSDPTPTGMPGTVPAGYGASAPPARRPTRPPRSRSRRSPPIPMLRRPTPMPGPDVAR